MISLLIAISSFTMVVCCHFYNKSILQELDIRMRFIFDAEKYLSRDINNPDEIMERVKSNDPKAILSVMDDLIIFGEVMKNKSECVGLISLKKRCDIIMFVSCGVCIGNAIMLFF